MSTNATPEFGAIRQQRRLAGLSQQTLAHKAECSIGYIRVVERGYQSDWDASPKLRRIAGVLGLDRDDLQAAS